jgi:GT2 family glycosyltransferase
METGKPFIPACSGDVASSDSVLPLVSLIIPTHGREAQLSQCLEAVAGSDYPRERYEVIVVDDGSERPPRSAVERSQAALPVRLLTQANQGPAAARNRGAEVAAGELLAFTDDDCMPAPRWLRSLAERSLKTPGTVLGGRTVNGLGYNRYAAASQLILDTVYRHYNADPMKARFLATNNLAVPAPVFHRIGGFDASFRISEDREFCDRCISSDIRLVYAPEALIYHRHDLTLRSYIGQHFGYGCGAFRYHRVRARRGSGRLWHEFSFHLNLRNWLVDPYADVPGARILPTALLLVVWQAANAAGFAWEALRSRCSNFKQLH